MNILTDNTPLYTDSDIQAYIRAWYNRYDPTVAWNTHVFSNLDPHSFEYQLTIMGPAVKMDIQSEFNMFKRIPYANTIVKYKDLK